MKLQNRIFRSEIPQPGRLGPHFENSKAIQDNLSLICKSWAKYLKSYELYTEKLFKHEMKPLWRNTERALVSSLSASIVRHIKNSIVIEEPRVVKPGQSARISTTKHSEAGRCDLWASFPESTNNTNFSFYLEAKKSHIKNLTTERLEGRIQSKNGISRTFRDLMKYHSTKPISQRSNIQNSNGLPKHEHYVVGLMITNWERTECGLEEIHAVLKEQFEKCQTLSMQRKNPIKTKDRRHMMRFPTVALIVMNEKSSGFVASFTVVESTFKLKQNGLGIETIPL